MDAAERSRAIREAIRGGRLPDTPARQLFAGRGQGDNTCNGCGLPIEVGATEYELDFGALTARLHLPCYAVWMDEINKP